MARWCVAYWCFYHAGFASFATVMASDQAYWDLLKKAAQGSGKDYPRSAERRHFRGAAAVKCVNYLAGNFPSPMSALSYLSHPTVRTSFTEVAARTMSWPLFGPWVAFKVADMLERVWRYPVDFSDCHLGIYAEPAAAAKLVNPKATLVETCNWLQEKLADMMAPPGNDRPIGIQEVETCLCKWKSHMNGHYPIGKDTAELCHGMAGWGELSERLRGLLP
jgi:hypothetical protein